MKRYYPGQVLTTKEQVINFVEGVITLPLPLRKEVVDHYRYSEERLSTKLQGSITHTTMQNWYDALLGTVDTLPWTIHNPHSHHVAKQYKFGELYSIDEVPPNDPTVTGYFVREGTKFRDTDKQVVAGTTGVFSYISRETKATHWTLTPISDMLNIPDRE